VGRRRARPLAGALLAMLLCSAWLCAGAHAVGYGPFGAPQPVAIEGWSGSAEEPFITPDGRYLLFNSAESSPEFSLQFASRVSAQAFEYQGEIAGEAVNVPGFLSGTPSLDDEGALYFISNRSYAETLSTVYAGQFSQGALTGVHLVPGISAGAPGTVDFDVGASANGSRLYVSAGQFGSGGSPSSASLQIFDRYGDGFAADSSSARILAAVNKVASLVYAADLSFDELELFFTAASPSKGEAPAIYRATRASTIQAFGHVERIAAITGFAEAPSISADGTTLYYHEQAGGEYQIETVARTVDAPRVGRLSPRKGPSAGHTTVTITGANFTGTPQVMFGSLPALSVTLNSGTSITAVSPPHADGTVEVSVSTVGGRSAPATGAVYTYAR